MHPNIVASVDVEYSLTCSLLFQRPFLGISSSPGYRVLPAAAKGALQLTPPSLGVDTGT